MSYVSRELCMGAGDVAAKPVGDVAAMPTSYGTTAPIPKPSHSGYGNFSSEYFSTEVEEGIGRAQDVLRARWSRLRACKATPSDAASRAADAAAACWIVA